MRTAAEFVNPALAKTRRVVKKDSTAAEFVKLALAKTRRIIKKDSTAAANEIVKAEYFPAGSPLGKHRFAHLP